VLRLGFWLVEVRNQGAEYGVRNLRVFRRLLGVEYTVIEDVELGEERGEEVVIARVRPVRARRSRCSRCQRRCRGYDAGEGRRRWRALDLGTVKAYLEADAPRVACPQHGVVVAAVPWARAGARSTDAFEDTCGWLAAHAAFTMVAALLAGVVADGGRDRGPGGR
jgi:transposase